MMWGDANSSSSSSASSSEYHVLRLFLTLCPITNNCGFDGILFQCDFLVCGHLCKMKSAESFMLHCFLSSVQNGNPQWKCDILYMYAVSIIHRVDIYVKLTRKILWASSPGLFHENWTWKMKFQKKFDNNSISFLSVPNAFIVMTTGNERIFACQTVLRQLVLIVQNNTGKILGTSHVILCHQVKLLND